MSLKWPAKDPDEILDYSVDWSRFLGSDTITGVTWYCEDADGVEQEITPVQTVYGLKFNAASNTNTVATVQLEAGTLNVMYRVVCEITFGASSLVSRRTIQLPIREK